LWIFVIGPILGGMLGWALYYYLYDNAGGTAPPRKRATADNAQTKES
jgi:hypothetical protein